MVADPIASPNACPTEPRHRLGHVLKFAAEVLDLVEEGKLILPAEDIALLERTRDQLVRLID